MHTKVNQCSLTDQNFIFILKKDVWTKDLFKRRDRPMDFSITVRKAKN